MSRPQYHSVFQVLTVATPHWAALSPETHTSERKRNLLWPLQQVPPPPGEGELFFSALLWSGMKVRLLTAVNYCRVEMGSGSGHLLSPGPEGMDCLLHSSPGTLARWLLGLWAVSQASEGQGSAW